MLCIFVFQSDNKRFVKAVILFNKEGILRNGTFYL